MKDRKSEFVLPKEAFTQILELLKPYKFTVFLALFIVLLPPYFSVWGPYLMGRLVDDGLLAKDYKTLFLFAGAIFGIKIILFFLNSAVTYSLSAFGLQILVDYRDQLLKRILKYPLRFFDKMSSGSLTTRLTNDISSLQELFSTALVPLLGNLAMILGIVGMMFWMNWKLALAALSVVPLLIWLVVVFDLRLRRRFGFMRKTLSSLNSFVGESFSGHREMKVLDAVDTAHLEFESLSRRWSDRFILAVREYALFNPIVPFITALMDIVIIGVGGYMILKNQMTVGEVVAFLGYASIFAWPVRDFSEKYTVLQQALAAVERLIEVSKQEVEDDSGNLDLTPPVHVEFQSVSLSYERDQRPALQNISFSVDPGQKIALLGETGSGKTSTCSLLMRFYESTGGQILFNGRDIHSYKLESLRSQIGWVSQDVFLFSDSLRENLRFYRAVSDEEIWKVLQLVQLKSWVESLPSGLDEVLTERASSLSSGQRQLISLARALLGRPKILIFDEATSYIDSLTELQIQRALEQLWSSPEFISVTAFFIAHRLSTLKRCDSMLVYRDGQIIERGSFEELIQLNGYAASLYREQFKQLA